MTLQQITFFFFFKYHEKLYLALQCNLKLNSDCRTLKVIRLLCYSCYTVQVQSQGETPHQYVWSPNYVWSQTHISNTWNRTLERWLSSDCCCHGNYWKDCWCQRWPVKTHGRNIYEVDRNTIWWQLKKWHLLVKILSDCKLWTSTIKGGIRRLLLSWPSPLFSMATWHQPRKRWRPAAALLDGLWCFNFFMLRLAHGVTNGGCSAVTWIALEMNHLRSRDEASEPGRPVRWLRWYFTARSQSVTTPPFSPLFRMNSWLSKYFCAQLSAL